MIRFKFPFYKVLFSFGLVLILLTSLDFAKPQTQDCKRDKFLNDSLELVHFLAVDPDEFTNLKARQQFYEGAKKRFAKLGYEVQWMKVASETVRMLRFADSKIGGKFAKTNPAISHFFNKGNKAIFVNTLKKMKALLNEKKILKGLDAVKWDAQILSDEQALISPYYQLLSETDLDVLDHNIKRWAARYVLHNPKFLGHIVDQENR